MLLKFDHVYALDLRLHSEPHPLGGGYVTYVTYVANTDNIQWYVVTLLSSFKVKKLQLYPKLIAPENAVSPHQVFCFPLLFGSLFSGMAFQDCWPLEFRHLSCHFYFASPEGAKGMKRQNVTDIQFYISI